MAVGDRLFYYPTSVVYGRPESHGLTYESVHFESGDGTALHGWFFPCDGPACGTVVHCHGNAGNITGHFESVRWLPERGWNVLCFDYRGYGQSAGAPTRSGTIEDARAALRYTLSRNDVDPQRVVMLGQSLGGSIGIVVAAECDSLRGLAVEGAFSHYRTEAAFICKRNILMRPVSGLLSRALISVGHEPIEWVGRVAPTPTLFVCGTRDRIVDYRQTIALHECAGEPKTLHVDESGGHTDSMCTPDGRERFVRFFNACVARPSP